MSAGGAVRPAEERSAGWMEDGRTGRDPMGGSAKRKPGGSVMNGEGVSIRQITRLEGGDSLIMYIDR